MYVYHTRLPQGTQGNGTPQLTPMFLPMGHRRDVLRNDRGCVQHA
jgi:hypothetical protein